MFLKRAFVSFTKKHLIHYCCIADIRGMAEKEAKMLSIISAYKNRSKHMRSSTIACPYFNSSNNYTFVTFTLLGPKIQHCTEWRNILIIIISGMFLNAVGDAEDL